MSAYVNVRSVTKSFGTHDVLGNLSLAIRQGDSVAITGPSGCGKTTLLNMLGLLDTPTKGEILLDGRPYPKINSRVAMLMRRSQINYLFQSFALIDSRTVRSNLLLALHHVSQGRDEKLSRMEQMLGRLGIGDKLDSVVNELSGGEKQRVAIARAMLKPGDLVLADEPTGSLDAAMAKIVTDELLSSSQEAGKTLVVVTHDEGVARACGRRIELAALR